MRYSRWAASVRSICLTVACTVSTGSAAEKESNDGLTAQQILDKMATTYATCKSYCDSGVVTNDFGPHNATDRHPRHVGIKPFRTAFVRSDQFRFEYDDATPDKPYIIWAKGGEVRKWWYINPGVEKLPSLSRDIGGATGVSSGSAHSIPALLLPDEITGAKISAMIDLTRLPDETLDGTPCFKLHGKYGFGNQPTTLWLEKATYLIRRIAQDTGLTKSTTIYRPEVNKEIPASELEFNAPTTTLVRDALECRVIDSSGKSVPGGHRRVSGLFTRIDAGEGNHLRHRRALQSADGPTHRHAAGAQGRLRLHMEDLDDVSEVAPHPHDGPVVQRRRDRHR